MCAASSRWQLETAAFRCLNQDPDHWQATDHDWSPKCQLAKTLLTHGKLHSYMLWSQEGSSVFSLTLPPQPAEGANNLQSMHRCQQSVTNTSFSCLKGSNPSLHDQMSSSGDYPTLFNRCESLGLKMQDGDNKGYSFHDTSIPAEEHRKLSFFKVRQCGWPA